MKKVGLMTIHGSYNYGAALQAYATVKTVSKLGLDCNCIDYYTKRGQSGTRFFPFPNSSENIKNCIRNALHPFVFLRRKNNFEKFKSQHLNLTSKKYSYNNIKEIELENFDFYITGSDQTFNINLGGNVQERKAYYLPFITKNKISYASSFGEHMTCLSDEQKTWIASTLKTYDNISVREQSAVDFIKKFADLPAALIADPTLAISKDEWKEISTSTKYSKEKYILFYTVLSAPWVVEYAKKLSKQTGLKVIAAHPQNSFEIKADFVRAADCGPREFISLVENCELFLTTSFHGTAFSIIFNKPFISLIMGEGNRITNLLKQCSLESRGYRNSPDISVDLYNVNFSKANDFLSKTIETNKAFLADNIAY